MARGLHIRHTTPNNFAQVLGLYPLTFPEEDLRDVVAALLEQGSRVLSLASFDGDALVAHVLFSICKTEGPQVGALLGPLGVIPARQRQGVGDTLVRHGLEQLQATGINQVFVLGNPAYYVRFGFTPEKQVLAPYPLPVDYGDAWQSMTLAERPPLTAGRLELPEPWMNPALW